MNFSIIFHILGKIMNIEAALMLLPLITGIIYGEQSVTAFLLAIAVCLLIGVPLAIYKPKEKVFYVREGFVTVALCWIVLSAIGALPFLFSGSISNPIDALFESVSGFTTTGASILQEVESLPKCILLWRSFTHWIGGMGVLVFLLSIMPMAGGSHMNLMKAESPGPIVSRLTPTIQSTAKTLYGIYIFMTLLEIIFLLCGGMPFFDSLATSLGTAGTGGFGIKNDSIAGYSPYLQNVVTVFMILFGVNFSAYYLILIKKFRQSFQVEEVRWYFGVILLAITVITINVFPIYGDFATALRQSAFQVGSIITTTGYSTTDFNLWPQASRTILVMLMFVGACAGSTGGGIKVSRFVIWLKTAHKELQQFLHPHSVKKIKMDGKPLEHETVRNTNVFLITYMVIFASSVLLLAFDNLDMVTNFTAVAATLNNIGPGLELVGPMSNFSVFSNPAKLVLIFDMLIGRLEIFPMLLLFVRGTWKRF